MEKEQSEFEREHTPAEGFGHGVHHIHLHGENHEELGELHHLPPEDQAKGAEVEHGESEVQSEKDEENKGEHVYPGMIRKQGVPHRY